MLNKLKSLSSSYIHNKQNKKMLTINNENMGGRKPYREPVFIMSVLFFKRVSEWVREAGKNLRSKMGKRKTLNHKYSPPLQKRREIFTVKPTTLWALEWIH